MGRTDPVNTICLGLGRAVLYPWSPFGGICICICICGCMYLIVHVHVFHRSLGRCLSALETSSSIHIDTWPHDPDSNINYRTLSYNTCMTASLQNFKIKIICKNNKSYFQSLGAERGGGGQRHRYKNSYEKEKIMTMLHEKTGIEINQSFFREVSIYK